MRLEPFGQASLLESIIRDHEEVALSFAKLVGMQQTVGNARLVLILQQRLENRITMQLNTMIEATSRLVHALNDGVLISERRVNFFIAIALSVVAGMGASFFRPAGS
jgi:hypothetical protein